MNASRTNRQGFSTLPVRGAVALATTVLAVVLLFSFKPADPTTTGLGGVVATDPPLFGAPAAQPTPAQVFGPPAPTHNVANGGTGTGTGTHRGATPAPPQSTPTAGGGGNSTVSGTFTGRAESTPYGTVQIALVVQNGTITDVQELQLPNDRRLSQQISAQAGPMLRDQVLRAQSDNINGVSGASYTSYGFYLSLQSALQQM